MSKSSNICPDCGCNTKQFMALCHSCIKKWDEWEKEVERECHCTDYVECESCQEIRSMLFPDVEHFYFWLGYEGMSMNKPTYFAWLETGTVFSYNGNQWRKRSKRTAEIINSKEHAHNGTWFYFRSNDLCYTD